MDLRRGRRLVCPHANLEASLIHHNLCVIIGTVGLREMRRLHEGVPRANWGLRLMIAGASGDIAATRSLAHCWSARGGGVGRVGLRGSADSTTMFVPAMFMRLACVYDLWRR